ncbi:thiamine pyrophosphate-dependent dehydrogenase E1 component subunit alpha [Acetobacter sp. TBRC 12305]|uniref:Thiamine pyrophosphate-dependent dehydrogenase E1 component subunit alpha n=1 Tax=Acetobacter garciniae TaxID=2817435 RepID=A0A939HPB2_9PROT|nr:thiamine pyrophosphate-dependent dehydrogenase E1 component subunit alpha [Acetobacter garciniae]MBO1326106.1 thiamine pyrophosphate-dependent dehydrogenase E1 component subunit alpha [Acetobacter garciniae]MBX0345149.1 thiamine pyrophosphate-dependent dehydrogenase E1 component subunit alpha [Acetobacter garciniae]
MTVLSVDERVVMHKRMLLVRLLEEELGTLHKAGKTRGPIHRCDGQEAVGIGATAALLPSDFITTTHRGHAHYIGKGLDIYGVFAEIMGKADGCCGGRAGHMLIGDLEAGVIGGNAIVGASIPAASGIALSAQIKKTSDVSMCFFGDGAAQTGICHESMNIAGLWKLPVVFVLEHNQYGLTVHQSVQSPVADLSLRARGYAMPGVIVDGNDVAAVYQAAVEAVARARKGDGPTMIEAKTYRVEGFSTSDMGGYQDAEEIARWKKRDPLQISYDALLPLIGAPALQAMADDAAREMASVTQKVLAAPLPEFELFTPSSPYVEVL